MSAAAIKVLVNTDYKMAEKACDILLRQKSKLADIAAQKKGTWRHSLSVAQCIPILILSESVQVHVALLPTSSGSQCNGCQPGEKCVSN